MGVPIIRTTIYWGLYCGLLILGNYQVASEKLLLPTLPESELDYNESNCSHNTNGRYCNTKSNSSRMVIVIVIDIVILISN